MKKITLIIIILIIIVLAVLGFFILNKTTTQDTAENLIQEETETGTTTQEKNIEEEIPSQGQRVIGQSAGGNNIEAFVYGTGDSHLLFVGGIHGGYSWNTALVAYNLIDYLEANPNAIPAGVRVSVVPVLNPDGLKETTGKTGRFARTDVATSDEVRVAGRFNGNNVDLNRNFDCDWQTEGKWQTRTVSGGSAAFSEPEAQAIREYVEQSSPDAVVVWYSSAGGVFASNCHNGVLPETREIMNVFASASGYKAYEEFNFYEITGDMTNWLAKIRVPAISILLTTHEGLEWDKNLKGIQALFSYYAKNQ